MYRKLLAAALVAPILAWAPASALAHGCASKQHSRHHTKAGGGETYGSSKSIQKKGSTSGNPSSQDSNQGAPSGSTAPSGSSGSSNEGQGI